MARVNVPVTAITPPKASHTTALSGSHNDLTFTAKHGGPDGNQIRVRYVVSGTNTALSIVVEAKDITVNVATNGGGSATSTATQVESALESSVDASALITVALASSNDGTGVVAAFSFTALTGGAWQTTPPSQVDGDHTNDHYLTGNDGDVMLEVVSSDAGAQTVAILYAPNAAAGATITAASESIAAGATRILGPFKPSLFNQNAAKDVYFDPSVSTTLKFRAYRITRAT